MVGGLVGAAAALRSLRTQAQGSAIDGSTAADGRRSSATSFAERVVHSRAAVCLRLPAADRPRVLDAGALLDRHRARRRLPVARAASRGSGVRLRRRGTWMFVTWAAEHAHDRRGSRVAEGDVALHPQRRPARAASRPLQLRTEDAVLGDGAERVRAAAVGAGAVVSAVDSGIGGDACARPPSSCTPSPPSSRLAPSSSTSTWAWRWCRMARRS